MMFSTASKSRLDRMKLSLLFAAFLISSKLSILYHFAVCQHRQCLTTDQKIIDTVFS